MALKKRAYSDEEKLEREQKIIDAADALLAEKSYSTINMSEIARTADLAKGTVYLYFQTKEELFLALFQRRFTSLAQSLEMALSALDSPTSKTAVCDILVEYSVREKQLMRLMALSNLIFEHNISYEKAREYKLALSQLGGGLGAILDDKLQLQAGQGLQIMYRLYIFIIGMENLANPAPVIQQVYDKDDTLQHPDWEAELRDLLMLVLDAV